MIQKRRETELGVGNRQHCNALLSTFLGFVKDRTAVSGECQVREGQAVWRAEWWKEGTCEVMKRRHLQTSHHQELYEPVLCLAPASYYNVQKTEHSICPLCQSIQEVHGNIKLIVSLFGGAKILEVGVYGFMIHLAHNFFKDLSIQGFIFHSFAPKYI